MESQNKIWLWALVAVLILAAAGWMWVSSREAVAPSISETAGPALTADDTTSAIEAELNATDFGDVGKELQSTEADLQSL